MSATVTATSSGPLQPGDIMVKYNDGSGVNNLISFGQFFGRGSSKFTHAGIASSDSTIVEMDGHGLQEHDLMTDNFNVSYRVYRCTVDGIGDGAAAAAAMMLEGFRSGATDISYTTSGAFRSISKRTDLPNQDVANDTLDKLLASGDAFFCSGHVVICYQMACSQAMAQTDFPISDAGGLFSLESTCYQPAYLEKKLAESAHFAKVGEFRGAIWVSA